MDYAGFYINLDRNPERRAELESELARYNLGHLYTRFRAAEGNALGFPRRGLKDGETGCFTSHYLLLKENLGKDRHLHIVEDDILFSDCTEKAIRWTFAQGFMSKYDIIFTDTYIPLQNDAYIAYKKFYDRMIARDDRGNITRATFNVIDLQDITFASTCSFLVNKDAIQKLHDIYEEELRRGPIQAVDLVIRRKASEGVLRIGCLFPSSRRSASTVSWHLRSRSSAGRICSRPSPSMSPAIPFSSAATGTSANPISTNIFPCRRTTSTALSSAICWLSPSPMKNKKSGAMNRMDRGGTYRLGLRQS
jgi:GR25 family glycosyltransferase involved in LPS biosynthesis